MAVSANTLFHFTAKESLKGILSSQGFFAQYSEEHFEDILPESSIYRVSLIPLVSFCDLTIIQLSRESIHTTDFGNYGIGLTKNWGIKMRVSPVVYVHENSQPSSQLYNLIKLFRRYDEEHEAEEIISQARRELVDSFKFIKPYKGRWQKGKEILSTNDDVIYYNEREWRYCPPLQESKVVSGVTAIARKRQVRLNRALKKKLIHFNPNDVKFIIIKEKSEIDEFIKIILAMDINKKQINELITKIITFQEINEDY
ncbi:MAG: hypothetical protein IPG01_04160 [Chitinophagaceae bacterium]|nr:hypothetical protein [Chitinophagaceae bacterium]